MKKVKILTSLLACSTATGIIVPLATSCTPGENVIKVESIEMHGQESILIGGTASFTVDVLPADATDKTVNWTSTDSNILTVNKETGAVEAKGTGQAAIVATANDGSAISAALVVNVIKPVESIQITSELSEIPAGDTVQLNASVLPSDATNKNVSWTSNKSWVATVDPITGEVLGKGAGKATITATAADGSGITATKEITVFPRKVVESLEIQAEGDFLIGRKHELNLKVEPEEASYVTATWGSSNPEVATVDPITGEVSPRTVGTTTITATANDGSGVSDAIQITVNPVLVEQIQINNPGLVAVEGKYNLNVDTIPEDATNKDMAWQVSDSSIASIDADGVLTAKAKGEVIITATTKDGSSKSDTLTITVGDAPKAENFETDPWSTFNYYASQGSDAFKKAYKIDGELDSLIGDKWDSEIGSVETKERTVDLNINGKNEQTKVRLIGVNHDNIDKTGQNKALFTFEFEECLHSSLPYGDNPLNILYEDSYLRDYCEYDFNNYLPDDLKSGIKTVVKDTWNYGVNSEDAIEDGEMVQTEEKLFALSHYEFAGEEDLEEEDGDKPHEGNPYKFYKVALGYPRYIYDHEWIRAKKDIETGEWCSYWERSPYLVHYDAKRICGAFYIFEGGESAGGYAINPKTQDFIEYGLAPCFCI